MSKPRDRLIAVTNSPVYNGIDFVEVTSPLTLVVHFLNRTPLTSPPPAASISGGDSITRIEVQPVAAADWGADADNRPTLTLTTDVTGDFSNYTLTLVSPVLDIMFSSTGFSFKAGCPSNFDCAPPPACCPDDAAPPPPIDYLSRDFQSFQQALLGFSSLRYPDWAERSEADFGMMMSEILSYAGDELSYLQDRVAAEASIVTATQRRSLVSLARLVDYEPAPATSGSTTLQCEVTGSGTVMAGVRVNAIGPDGGRIPFEIGMGINDSSHYPVREKWNFDITPYWFDDGAQCLPAGAPGMWVLGHGFAFTIGQAILVQTDLPGESLRQIVHLTQAGFETADPIFETNHAPTKVTQLVWGSDDALTQARDLLLTIVGGNLLPATQGERVSEVFATGAAPASAAGAVLAIARRGPNGSDAQPNFVYRYPLAQGPLGWLANADPDQAPAPEIILSRALPAAGVWQFAASLLGSQGTETDFTVDPVAWQVVGRTATGEPANYDVAGCDGAVGDAGSTIRFGNDVFGASPSAGDLFTVQYRTGLGARGNVAADCICYVDPTQPSLLSSARNPFAVASGVDAESAAHITRMAPQAFRAEQYRAVLAADYEAAAETLPWVEKAGTCFRWTGSWMTVFTAADPHGGGAIGTDQEITLVELLNRYRLAGYESYAPPPVYVSVDLRIDICVQTGWLDGDVEQGVLAALSGAACRTAGSAFFFADNFTFGTPLYRSRLDAAIQNVPGVLGVRAIAYRKRGAFAGFRPLPEILAPAPDQILRIENDPDWPERGTIRVVAEGGR